MMSISSTDSALSSMTKTSRNEQLQPILDSVDDKWSERESEEREEFRSALQSYIRLYGYISQLIYVHRPRAGEAVRLQSQPQQEVAETGTR